MSFILAEHKPLTKCGYPQNLLLFCKWRNDSIRGQQNFKCHKRDLVKMVGKRKFIPLKNALPLIGRPVVWEGLAFSSISIAHIYIHTSSVLCQPVIITVIIIIKKTLPHFAQGLRPVIELAFIVLVWLYSNCGFVGWKKINAINDISKIYDGYKREEWKPNSFLSGTNYFE